MGEHEAWAKQPSGGLMPNGLLPDEAASVMRVLDSERWSKAEERTAELIACIQPNPPSEDRRNAVADYVQRLVTKCFPCQVFTFGSVPLKTYLPDGDIDLTAFCKNQSLKESWAHQVRDVLENEEKNDNAEFRVKEVQYIQAEVKLIKCLVENIVVDISFNQLGGLCTLCFLEEVDHLINQDHLFKRSIILIKAWCYYESRILGAHHGLISTYALETLVLYIFHVFNNTFAGPLEVLYRFLEFFSKFDWENFCISLWGPVPITSLPDVTAEPPRKDGGDLLLSKLFLDACSSVYAVFPNGQESSGPPFISKHFNVIDPLRINNNLGRSVSKGNFFRIRSAFAFGAKRLARLLDCPKEDLCFEVNEFFTNTWDRHGDGQRPDAPINDLRRLRLSNHDLLHGPELTGSNASIKQNQILSSQEYHDSHTNVSTNLPSRQGSVESTLRSSDASTVSRIQAQNKFGNSNSKTSEQIKKEANNHGAQVDKVQRSFKPDNLVNEMQSRFFLARTRSSPELSDAYDEVPSRPRQGETLEGGKSQMPSRLDNSSRKTKENDNVASQDIRSTDDPSSGRRISSRQSHYAAVESRIGLNSYQDGAALRATNDDFGTVSGAQGMQQEDQDLVNIMASSAARGFNGPVSVPLNLASHHHLPLPIPPSVLASLGYAQRNIGGMLPPNLPMIENPWGTNMHFPPGVVPSHLSHYFRGMSLARGPEDQAEPANENFTPVEMNLGEGDRDFWHEQDRRSAAGHDMDNGGYEMLRSDDKQQSTSSGYNFSPSPRVGSAGSSMRGQQKLTKEIHGSTREDHIDDFSYHDSRGNEGYFDDRTVSSRSVSASHAGSMRSKTSSESSWEGSSAKASKSTREKRSRRTSPFSVPSANHGKDKCVSENSSTQADDDNKDWNLSSPKGTEVAERNIVPHTSWQVSRHQLPGFESAQTSGSESLMPFAPMVLNSHSRQRGPDGQSFTFYATGPPVPFVTMLPVYNFPRETGNPDASTSNFSVSEVADNSNFGQNFDLPDGADQHVPNSLESMKRDSPLALPEIKPDILNGDFASHWKNLQFGRFCQDLRQPHPPPVVYQQPPVMPPPGYFPGRVDGPGRPVSANVNAFSQVMSYTPQIVPVAPPQNLPARPTAVYQRYVDELPRYRTGTGTYLPNPKVSLSDRHSTGTRRGNYSYDRNDHHGDREANWNNPKSRPSSRGGYNRSHSEKSNARLDRLTGAESRSERPWSSRRQDSAPVYQSQNGPIRTNAVSTSTTVPYGMYSLPGMNHGGVSSNMPSLIMLYPYDNNAGYAPHPEQLEFGSLGPMGFSSPTELPHLNERSRIGAAFEDQRFHSGSAQQSPDQPSSPHRIQR